MTPTSVSPVEKEEIINLNQYFRYLLAIIAAFLLLLFLLVLIPRIEVIFNQPVTQNQETGSYI